MVNWLLILKVFLFIDIMLLFFLLGFGIGGGIFSIDVLKSSDINLSLCVVNNSLDNIVKCLNDDFQTWFKYNISNSGVSLNYSELVDLGGVCTHATDWYEEYLTELGFKTEEITIRNTSGGGHRFLIVWDKDTSIYCLIDQINYKCYTLG